MNDLPDCPPDHPRFRIEELCRFMAWTSHGSEWHIIEDMGPSSLDRQDCANCAIAAWLDEVTRQQAIQAEAHDLGVLDAWLESGKAEVEAQYRIEDWRKWKDRQPAQEGTG